MKKLAALLIIFSVSSLSFGIGNIYKESKPKPILVQPTKQESEIRININGLDNDIAKHIQVLDSIVNVNNARIFSKSIQIDSTNVITNYNISFIYKLIYQDNQDKMINFIKNKFKGLQVGYNQSSSYTGQSDSVRVVYYTNFVSKEYNNFQKAHNIKAMREQQYPILILIGVISAAVIAIITLTLFLIKLILRK